MVIFYGHLSLLESIVWYCLIKLTTVFFSYPLSGLWGCCEVTSEPTSQKEKPAHSVHLVLGESFIGISW